MYIPHTRDITLSKNVYKKTVNSESVMMEMMLLVG